MNAKSAPPRGIFDCRIQAPFAVLGIVADHDALSALAYLPAGTPTLPPGNRTAAKVARELERYLADGEFRFTIPLSPRGTAFQQRVWQSIAAIPVGESRTYGEVARSVRSAPRAVGQACGANRIALVIPCHRVVGSRGALGGFMNAGAGEAVAIKRWLLVHEGYRFGQ